MTTSLKQSKKCIKVVHFLQKFLAQVTPTNNASAFQVFLVKKFSPSLSPPSCIPSEASFFGASDFPTAFHIGLEPLLLFTLRLQELLEDVRLPSMISYLA